jgi:hypothetical protein
MRFLVQALVAAATVLAVTGTGRAQPPGAVPAAPDLPEATDEGPVTWQAADVPPAPPRPSGDELSALDQRMKALRALQAATAAAAQEKDLMRKQLEVQQKQIETLEKMIRLLADQLRKQPAAGPAVEKLQGQVATLEARSKQAARRDRELASAVDDINEQRDVEQRYGPQLPATLKELFLPSQTNETPLSIYTNLAVGYNAPESQTAGFFFGEFAPHLRLVLNDWIYAVGEIDVFANGMVDVSDAEVDFIVNDWLTVVAGRFAVPLGFFNERLNSPWINKLPDEPLLFRQVSPPFATIGVQARGACYLGDLPVKMEYAAYISNGLELNNPAPDVNDLANLENMQNTYDVVTSTPTYGGRLAFWYPAAGLEVGVSGLANGPYTPGPSDAIKLWNVDANYHKGDWDLRFEYAELYQHAESFIGTNIRRRGLYAQVAYRPLELAPSCLANLEGVFRYSYANFRGIDSNALDLTTFTTPVDVPVNRHQFTIGVNYWFYASMVLELAYEINQEPGFPLHDNIFMAQLAWGF